MVRSWRTPIAADRHEYTDNLPYAFRAHVMQRKTAMDQMESAAETGKTGRGIKSASRSSANNGRLLELI